MKGGEDMIKNKVIKTFATGALMLALLTPLSNLLGGVNTSTSVSNQTGVSVLGNTVNTSTSVSTQLGL